MLYTTDMNIETHPMNSDDMPTLPPEAANDFEHMRAINEYLRGVRPFCPSMLDCWKPGEQ